MQDLPSPAPSSDPRLADGAVAGVVAGRGDRLGARLRNFLHAWRFARAHRAPLLWIWYDVDDQDGSPYPLADLFDPDALAAIPGLEIVHRARSGRPVDPVSPFWAALHASRDRWQTIDQLIADADAPLPTGLVVRFDATRAFKPDEPHQDIVALFRSLPIHPAVRAAVADALAHDPSDHVAIHLRRGDIVSCLVGQRAMTDEVQVMSAIRNFVPRYADLGAYERAIATHAADARLTIFSDDAALRASVVRRFAGRVLDPHTVLDGCGLTPLQRDFAEFLLIAGARAVIGGTSHFCTVPAVLGGATMVDVRDYASADEVAAALHDMFGYDDLAPPPHRLIARVLDGFAGAYLKLGHAGKAADFARTAAAARATPAMASAAS